MTQVSRATHASSVATKLADNGAGDISAQDVREVITDLEDSVIWHDEQTGFAASDTTTGTFADARIAASNVTQHQAALSITESQISDLNTTITATLAATTNGNGASTVGVEDAAGLLAATDVEAAIAELANVQDGHGDITTHDAADFVGATDQGYRVFDAGGSQSAARPTNVPSTQTVAWRNYGTSGLPTNIGSYDIVLDEPGITFQIAVSDETTALTTGTAKRTFRMPYAMTLTDIRASVTTAPTGAALTVDVNEGGTTILSTKLTIDAGEETSTTAATAAVISDSALADDAEITIDIDQVGSTVAGAGLKVTFYGNLA